MADFKCKYCGNRLHPAEGQTVITCGRCDETTRIVLADNAKKQRLLEEAANLRFGCLFDRAMQRYENVIQEFPKDADAYWGYVLCIYGVEFQEDTRTGKRLPTLHRISSCSILKDPYYQKAIEYANPVDASDYRRIAAELERIRQRFIELSQKEENTYDIFISFKQTDDRLHRETIDCSKAENLYYKLKDMGYRIFFSKVTLANRGGDDYEPIIYTALDSAKIMLAVGSSRENLEAPWVRNEWNRFLDMMQTRNEKKLLPVYFGDMTPEKLPDSLRGIQGYDIETQRGVDRVLSRVEALLPRKKQEQSDAANNSREFAASEESLLKRARMEANTKNWNKAIEYYNRILDANPESSEAWVGLMLSEEQFFDVNEYKAYLIDKWLTSDSEAKSVSLFKEEVDLVNSCTVPNYLSEEEIMTALPEELVYHSRYKSMCQNQTAAVLFFEENQNYRHAIDCADSVHRAELTDFKDEILRKIQEAVDKTKEQEAEESSRLRKKYKEQLEAARNEIMERHQNAVNQREADYKKGMEVRVGKDVPAAIQCLKKVGNYHDAPQKLEKLLSLKAVSADIGDGSTYLTQRIINEKPQAVTNLKNAMAHLSAESTGGIGKWIALGLYAFVIFTFIISGDIRAIACIALGVAVGAILWKYRQLYAAYIAFAVFHTIAGAFLSNQWIAIMPVIYIISFVRQKGYARSVISRKMKMLAVDDAKRIVNVYEQNLRSSIDDIWESAIGIEYDGVKMQGILETLEKNNYSVKIGTKPLKTGAKPSKTEADDAVLKDSFDMEAFNELFEDLLLGEDGDTDEW